MPFRFRLFDGRMFVESAAPESGLVRGDEIDALDGRPVRELVSRLGPLVSVDGYTDHTRPQSLETDFDLLGSSFEQYYAFEVLGLDRWPSRVEIAWRDARGVAHRATRPTLAFDAWIALGDSPYRQNFGDAVSLSRPEEGIAVLRVETFVNYRQPVDADALLAPLFRKLKADGVTTLIVDLRDNGGGSDDAQIALMRHLYQRPFRLGGAAWAKTLDFEGLRAHLDTWNPAILEPDPAWFTEREGRHYVAPGIMGPAYAEQRPAPDAFEGRLLLLSSVRNASATAALLAAMAREPNVTVVGEPTGGNQGGTTASQIVFLKLPHSGITVRVPLLRAEPANPGAVDGQGVTPDVYVTPRLDDWRDGRDVVLERALELASRGLPAAD